MTMYTFNNYYNIVFHYCQYQNRNPGKKTGRKNMIRTVVPGRVRTNSFATFMFTQHLGRWVRLKGHNKRRQQNLYYTFLNEHRDTLPSSRKEMHQFQRSGRIPLAAMQTSPVKWN